METNKNRFLQPNWCHVRKNRAQSILLRVEFSTHFIAGKILCNHFFVKFKISKNDYRTEITSSQNIVTYVNQVSANNISFCATRTKVLTRSEHKTL